MELYYNIYNISEWFNNMYSSKKVYPHILTVPAPAPGSDTTGGSAVSPLGPLAPPVAQTQVASGLQVRRAAATLTRVEVRSLRSVILLPAPTCSVAVALAAQVGRTVTPGLIDPS